MSANDNKFNDLLSNIQKESNTSSKHSLENLTFIYGIHENSLIEKVVRVAEYVSFVVCAIAVFSLLIGIFATFYGQIYLSIFSSICILHLLIGPFAYLAFEDGKRVFYVTITGLNLIWIGLSLSYFITYVFLKDNDSFDSNIMHHFLFFVYLLISVGLQVVYVMLAIKLILFFEQKISQLNESKT